MATEQSTAGTSALTLAQAWDFVYEELAKGDLPILPQAEHELFDRARRAEGDDPARLAARLGLTKAAAKKRLEEPAH